MCIVGPLVQMRDEENHYRSLFVTDRDSPLLTPRVLLINVFESAARWATHIHTPSYNCIEQIGPRHKQTVSRHKPSLLALFISTYFSKRLHNWVWQPVRPAAGRGGAGPSQRAGAALPLPVPAMVPRPRTQHAHRTHHRSNLRRVPGGKEASDA